MKRMFSPLVGSKTTVALLLVLYLSYLDAAVSGMHVHI